MGPTRRKWRPLRILGIIAVTCGVAAIGVALWAAWGLHRIDLDKPPGSRPSLMLEAADGTPIGGGGSYAGPVRRDDIPDHLMEAIVAIEDRRFYDHMGFDPIGILRAAWRNARAGGVVEGGSTITQQLAKVLFLEPERTLRRKLQEAVIATWLDMRLSKDEILVKYLDSVYFGSGATGISAAAKVYFNKAVRELSLAEAAMLAGSVRAPSKLNPLTDLGAARERASVVVNAMMEAGFITRDEALSALLRPATPVPAAQSTPIGGWFADWVRSEAEKAIAPLAGAARIRTTLQPRLQAMAENAVRLVLDRDGRARNAGQAALVAITPDGAVVAMVGGRSYEDSQFNRAVEARRQPGSAFTVFVYLAALRAGWRPEDRILDAPIEIDGWRPKNSPDRYFGEVTLTDAFAKSLSTPTVRLAQDVGIENIIETAREMGIESEMDENLTVALGTAEVSLLDLTGAYASIAGGRQGREPWAIAGFSGAAGAGSSMLPQRHSPPELQHRDELVGLLTAAVREGTGGKAALDGFAAGKTGTSEDYRDAWFVGFTETLVAGVWIGNDDNSPMDGVTGGDLAADIWREFMAKATGIRPQDAPAPPPPATAPDPERQIVSDPPVTAVSPAPPAAAPAVAVPGRSAAPVRARESRGAAPPIAATATEAKPPAARTRRQPGPSASQPPLPDGAPPALRGRPAMERRLAAPPSDGPSILLGGRGIPGRGPAPAPP